MVEHHPLQTNRSFFVAKIIHQLPIQPIYVRVVARHGSTLTASNFPTYLSESFFVRDAKSTRHSSIAGVSNGGRYAPNYHREG